MCSSGFSSWPYAFSMYVNPLSTIIDSHHYTPFADDLQLQMSAPPDKITELLTLFSHV